MNDRLFSLLLLVTALSYGFMACRLDVPFAFDPLGPQPLPLTLAVLVSVLIVLNVCSTHTPARSDQSALKRIASLFIIILFYQLTWAFLGFLLATTISIYLLSRLFLCSWMQGLMTALLVSVLCYGLFNFVFKIPLPLGTLFSYGSG